MGLVTGITLPNDGDRIKAANYNDPISKIIAQVNGNLDSSNIASLSGTKISANTIPQTALDSTNYSGWISGKTPPTSIVYNGNRSYSLTYAASIAGYKSAGMRTRLVRSTAAPTQCTNLNGTTQYYSKAAPAGMAQTDSITQMAWIKLSSYGTNAGIISRQNGTTDGWIFFLNTSGQVYLQGARTADDVVNSYQSVPLNKWVHVAASINSAGATGAIYIDGILVPSLYTNNANTGFLAPTQSYLVGATNGAAPTNFFPGKIAQAASFSAVLSAATIRSYVSQGLVGTETSLISAYSFNNSINDLNTTNANNLTANGSAVATNADSPFCNNGATNNTDYYITQLISADGLTETVQVPEGCTLPTTGSVTSIDFSSQKVPLGMPIQEARWTLESSLRVLQSMGATVGGTWYNIANINLTLPVGEWMVGGTFNINAHINTAAPESAFITISTSPTAETDRDLTGDLSTNPTNDIEGQVVIMPKGMSISAQTPLYAPQKSSQAVSSMYSTGDRGAFKISAKNSYL